MGNSGGTTVYGQRDLRTVAPHTGTVHCRCRAKGPFQSMRTPVCAPVRTDKGPLKAV